MKHFYIKLLSIVLAVILVLSISPLFQIGDTFYEYENCNYNGYFALQDEDILIDYGYTYADNYFHSMSGRYMTGYYKVYTYGLLSFENQVYLSSVHIVFSYVLNSSLNYYTSGITVSLVRIGVIVPNNIVIWGSGQTTMDAINNYQIFIMIFGISNYGEGVCQINE